MDEEEREKWNLYSIFICYYYYYYYYQSKTVFKINKNLKGLETIQFNLKDF